MYHSLVSAAQELGAAGVIWAGIQREHERYEDGTKHSMPRLVNRRSAIGRLLLAGLGLGVVLCGCDKKVEPVAAPSASLTVGPGLKVYLPFEPIKVSIVTIGADGKTTATFAGRVAAGGQVFSAGSVPSGGSARLRFDRGGLVGRGDPAVWFKSEAVGELEKTAIVGEYVYKGGEQEVTVEADGPTVAVTPGPPAKK